MRIVLPFIAGLMNFGLAGCPFASPTPEDAGAGGDTPIAPESPADLTPTPEPPPDTSPAPSPDPPALPTLNGIYVGRVNGPVIRPGSVTLQRHEDVMFRFDSEGHLVSLADWTGDWSWYSNEDGGGGVFRRLNTVGQVIDIYDVEYDDTICDDGTAFPHATHVNLTLDELDGGPRHARIVITRRDERLDVLWPCTPHVRIYSTTLTCILDVVEEGVHCTLDRVRHLVADGEDDPNSDQDWTAEGFVTLFSPAFLDVYEGDLTADETVVHTEPPSADESYPLTIHVRYRFDELGRLVEATNLLTGETDARMTGLIANVSESEEIYHTSYRYSRLGYESLISDSLRIAMRYVHEYTWWSYNTGRYEQDNSCAFEIVRSSTGEVTCHGERDVDVSDRLFGHDAEVYRKEWRADCVLTPSSP